MDPNETYFYTKLNFPAIEIGEIFEVYLDYDLSGYSESDFRIAVIGQVFCLVDELNQCNDLEGKWDLATNLINPVRVKTTGFFKEKTALSFEIQNTRTGDVYRTPKKYLWQKGFYSSYISNLNINLMSDTAKSDYSEPGSLNDHNRSLIFLPIYLLPIVLLLGFMVVKMIKSRNGSN